MSSSTIELRFSSSSTSSCAVPPLLPSWAYTRMFECCGCGATVVRAVATECAHSGSQPLVPVTTSGGDVFDSGGGSGSDVTVGVSVDCTGSSSMLFSLHMHRMLQWLGYVSMVAVCRWRTAADGHRAHIEHAADESAMSSSLVRVMATPADSGTWHVRWQ